MNVAYRTWGSERVRYFSDSRVTVDGISSALFRDIPGQPGVVNETSHVRLMFEPLPDHDERYCDWCAKAAAAGELIVVE